MKCESMRETGWTPLRKCCLKTREKESRAFTSAFFKNKIPTSQMRFRFYALALLQEFFAFCEKSWQHKNVFTHLCSVWRAFDALTHYCVFSNGNSIDTYCFMPFYPFVSLNLLFSKATFLSIFFRCRAFPCYFPPEILPFSDAKSRCLSQIVSLPKHFF